MSRLVTNALLLTLALLPSDDSFLGRSVASTPMRSLAPHTIRHTSAGVVRSASRDLRFGTGSKDHGARTERTINHRVRRIAFNTTIIHCEVASISRTPE